VGELIEVVCTECREQIALGPIERGSPPHGPEWHIRHVSETTAQELDYFLLVHRGHVLGAVDSGTIDSYSPDEAPIRATWSLEELVALHPDTGLTDADELAPASSRLAAQLGDYNRAVD
jgi:hypothetical protein